MAIIVFLLKIIVLFLPLTTPKVKNESIKFLIKKQIISFITLIGDEILTAVKLDI